MHLYETNRPAEDISECGNNVLASSPEPPQTELASSCSSPQARIAGSSQLRSPAFFLSPRRLPWPLLLVLLLTWSFMYLLYWPLASMNDTFWMFKDPFAASGQHPPVYTLLVSLVVHASNLLTGSFLSGVVALALAQMVLLALTLVTALSYLTQHSRRASYLRWGLTALFALYPLSANYSFALVKDATFNCFVILTSLSLLHLWRTRGKALSEPSFRWLLVVSLVGVGVTRNNGTLVVLVLCGLLFFWARAARKAALRVAVLILILTAIPGTILKLCHHSSPAVEAVGIPLQMVGYTFKHEPECLPQTSREYFSQILPPADWAKRYNPATVDPLKDAPNFQREVLDQQKRGFLSAWARGLWHCPRSFFTAYALHTKIAWSPLPGFLAGPGQTYFDAPVSNLPGPKAQILEEYRAYGVVAGSPLPDVISGPLRYLSDLPMRYTPQLGTWIWGLIVLIIGFACKRTRDWLPFLTPFLLCYLTLLVAAPTFYPFRYSSSIIYLLPLTIGLLVTSQSSRPAKQG